MFGLLCKQISLRYEALIKFSWHKPKVYGWKYQKNWKEKARIVSRKIAQKRKIKQNNELKLRESKKGWIKDVDKQTEYWRND